jgi:uncharacterized protein YndB with AHSA1/START domain
VATNKRFMTVPAEAVWDVLADSGGYAYWVVGSKRVRDADPEWPEPGSRFHHTVGIGPFESHDHTVVIESEPPHRLEVRAKGRPVGTATVKLTMTPQDGGTLVHITETPDGPFRILALNPVLHLLTLSRNAESLMRLEELALRATERRSTP